MAKPFLWGVATSSHQVEGNNLHNDWWHWEEQGNIEGGAKSGRATDHWNLFETDLDHAANLGLNSYRFSVEWSRVEPKPGEWNREALDWYRALIGACEKRGLKPMLTLHHFTSPQWFAEKGGFNWSEAPYRFLAYTQKVIDAVGHRIPLWCTLNEPMVLVGGGYLGGFMPPAKFDPKGATLASSTLLDCHARAYDLIHREVTRREGPWASDPLEVGIAHNMLDFRADRFWNLIEWTLAGIISRFYNHDWLDAVTGKAPNFGIPFLIPRSPRIPSAFGRKTVDFIGVNYYTKAYVQWRPKQATHPRPNQSPVGMHFAKRRDVASDLDWAIHPSGFRKVLKKAASYGVPLYVTENGIADKDDLHRARYLKEHLCVLGEVAQEGVDIRGYYHWSLIDNFEWIKGFGPRFGLIHVDYDTLRRTPRKSANTLKEIVMLHDRSQPPNPNLLKKIRTE